MTSSSPCLLIKTDTAPKTGLRAQGAIGYRVLTDEGRTEIFLAITANLGGSGLFSKEPVAFSRVEQCLDRTNREKPLPSKTFKAAFLAGRSANNSGFLAAVLRHEKLLEAAPGSRHLHVVSEDWSAWKAATLALPAEPLIRQEQTPATVQASTNGADEGCGVEQDRLRKPRKNPGGKRQHPTVEYGDENPT